MNDKIIGFFFFFFFFILIFFIIKKYEYVKRILRKYNSSEALGVNNITPNDYKINERMSHRSN